MAEYLTTIAEQIGIPFWFLIVIFLWTTVWKLLALWKSARKGSVIWFIILAVFNTVGILPILYIFVFSKLKCCEFKTVKSKTRQPKKVAKKKVSKKKVTGKKISKKR